MKTIDEISLEVAQDMGLIANSVYEAFAKQFLAAWLAQQEPVAWAATSDEGKVEALGFNASRRFDTPLFLAPPPAVPDGYVLVPKEPTKEMLSAGCQKLGALYGHHGARSMYQAMIAAQGEQE